MLAGNVEDALWDLPALVATGLDPLARSGRELEWPLGSERGRWTIGRGSACDFVLAGDDAVSRRHAEIAVRAGLCLVRDLDSCNGTLLNGQSVRRARLRRGDLLLIGETEIRVR